MMNIEKLACLLDDLVIAKTIYDLVKLGYNPTTLYRTLNSLVKYGFINITYIDNVRYYHLTGLGAELLKILKKAIVNKLAKNLSMQGIKYKIWWGDNETRAISPIVYVDREITLPVSIKKLIRVKIGFRE